MDGVGDGSGAITLAWGDGEHRFRLRYGEMRELQGKTGFGPPRLLERLRGLEWDLPEVREIIRIGLVGGGLDPAAALRLVERYFDETPWIGSHRVAYAVLAAAFVGPPIKKKRPPRTRKAASDPTGDGTSSASTEPGSSSDSRPATSTP